MALDQFALARKRAGQQSQAGLQAQQDAIKRRFASIGGSSSGAAMKAEQIAAEKSQEQLGQAEEGITAAETAEKSRLGEIEQARTFAQSERQSQQEFAKGEAEKARQFAIAERGAGEKFQSEQTAANRSFQERVQAFNESESGKAMALALRQFEQDAATTEFNKRKAIAEGRREGISPSELLPPGELENQQVNIPQRATKDLVASYVRGVKKAGYFANANERKNNANFFKTLSPEAQALAFNELKKWEKGRPKANWQIRI
jgi:hypothetical protein